MKKYVLWPLLAAIGGVGAFLLRLLQRSTGFEVDTGLPIPGNLYAILLVAWFVVLAAVCLLAVPVVLFGNRNYDDALSELRLTLRPLSSYRMDQDRKIQLFADLIDRPELFLVNSFSVHMCVDLDSLCPHILASFDLFHRRRHIVKRDTPDKSTVTVRIAVCDLFDLIISNSCQLR